MSLHRVAAELVIFALGLPVRPRKLFVGLVRTNLYQCNDMVDIHELGALTAAAEPGYRHLNAGADNFCNE